MRPFLSLLLIGILISCDSSKNPDEFKPDASGAPDDLMIVIDQEIWDSEVGSQLKSIYQKPMLALPQDEPMFKVRKINPMRLNRILRTANNMIIVMTLDGVSDESKRIRSFFTDESLKKVKADSSFYYATADNKYARGQKVLYLFAETAEQLVQKIAQNKEALFNLFETRAQQLTKNKVFGSRERDLEKVINQKHGYSIGVPFGWEKSADKKDFLWLRVLDPQYEKNVFIYEEPYRGPEIFEDIAGLRDRITELHLRDGQYPELYIMRQELIPVFTESITFKNKFAVKARGLWKISDATAGGPFLSYVMVDEEIGRLYYIEGYVYNPGGDKKPLMREVEAILSTFRIPSEIK